MQKKMKQTHQGIILYSLFVIVILFSFMQIWFKGDVSRTESIEDRGNEKNQQNHQNEHMVTEPIKKSENESLSTNQWMLLLVNPWNSLPSNYTCKLKQMENGQAVDERCYQELQNMMDDCREAGLSPYICSSYRTNEKQTELFQQQVKECISMGYSRSKAESEAATSVAIPGTSEHQLGLAVDIIDQYYTQLNQGQEDTKTQKWLMNNSWKYGFILRYPSDKSNVTGIIYEPWHYRYVGKDAAKYIYDHDMCLEEYLKIYGYI